ncbi:hypothetical protein D3C75_1231110 [compost metagenome]
MFSGIALLAEGDQAAHPALDHIPLPDKQGGCFIKNGFKVNRGVVTGDGDLQAEQGGEGLL